MCIFVSMYIHCLMLKENCVLQHFNMDAAASQEIQTLYNGSYVGSP